ncbi:MAG TPA: hypothetical protein VM305_03220 [Candidatus Limnocylindrales bacterium]|nr:hypothetical protein [Candidatus Limnocylindrales bacterium]
MRKLISSMLVTGLLVAALAGPAAGRGLTAERLTEAGWYCFPVNTLGVHCMPPGTAWGDRHIQLLYFDHETRVYAGTESLVRADAFKGNRQCRTDPSGGWLDLVAAIGYYACHRN